MCVCVCVGGVGVPTPDQPEVAGRSEPNVYTLLHKLFSILIFLFFWMIKSATTPLVDKQMRSYLLIILSAAWWVILFTTENDICTYF